LLLIQQTAKANAMVMSAISLSSPTALENLDSTMLNADDEEEGLTQQRQRQKVQVDDNVPFFQVSISSMFY